MKKLCLLFALLPLLWGCGDTLMETAYHGGAGKDGVPVQIVLGGGSLAPSRTIAPSHIPYSDWTDPAKYKLRMTATSDMGGHKVVDNFAVSNNMGIMLLEPGAWDLALTATNLATSKMELTGNAFLIVQDAPTATHIDLEPVTTEAGTVRVQFTLPQALVKELNPAGSNNKPVTVSLYDLTGAEVQSTRQTLTANAADANSVVTYTANGAVAPGEYTIELTATYPGTKDTKTFGWKSVLYVEGNREAAENVRLSAMSLGRPSSKPTNKAKAGNTITVATSNSTAATQFGPANITGSQSFQPYGDGLWIYAANWDGDGTNRTNGTWGNEILLVTWDPVFDASYYELELMIHPYYGYLSGGGISNYSKYERLPVSDADWNSFLGRNPQPKTLAFTGDNGSANYYRSKTYTYQILQNSQSTWYNFKFLAWRAIANNSNQDQLHGAAGRPYTVLASSTNNDFISVPNANGVSTYRGRSYRIGLEGDCNALAILMHSFTPQHWYGIRVRAVNEFGHSDWVYWKGGKN